MITPTLTVSSSPHLHEKSSTASIMYHVSIALAPALVWGVYVFGVRALLVVIVSIAASMICEYLLG
ncbi:MAG: RnfABCDGE type electron transport complex subunit D, partial [Sphaerochaeta sp.]|nr:RnfABCDGE type electron transport complex subunit D [Sphaerochaeta sp.]